MNVVKGSSFIKLKNFILSCIFQILNDIAGDLDAKKACANAMKLHKKYLKQVAFFACEVLEFHFFTISK